MAAPQKKMNLMQLTFIVAVNMMGSGIIMLPTNMAQVGAISLLSWIVTAVGSMAIAYGFAQAGLFNQRAGGMAAYAEDAYGKDGYFQVFFLYFLSLAIGNVAIAISAVGYLASFVPWLSSTPVATTMGVIGLIWLTFIGFALAMREGTEIRVDLADHYLPLQVRQWIYGSFDVLLLVVIGIVVWKSWQSIGIGQMQVILGTSFSVAVPTWGMLIGVVLMFVVVAVRLARRVANRPGVDEHDAAKLY